MAGPAHSSQAGGRSLIPSSGNRGLSNTQHLCPAVSARAGHVLPGTNKDSESLYLSGSLPPEWTQINFR